MVRVGSPEEPGPPGRAGASDPTPPVGFREALRFWARLGCVNFGGPAGQIALMHRELVERRGWVTEGQFLRALNFCMILPGPEAQQLATYIGWRLHGTRGGLAAGSLFVLPSVFVLLLLSWLVAVGSGVPAITGLLYGVQPVVLAIVAEAVARIGRRTLRRGAHVAIAAAAFAAIVVLSVPFPLIIVTAALAGVALERRRPGPLPPHGPQAAVPAVPAGPSPQPTAPRAWPRLGRAARIGAIAFVLWAIPVLAIRLMRGGEDVLLHQALFFTQAAFVTLGGAYAVLAYIADVAVNRFAWLGADQMMQGLALAESTPGPLIMVVQYVGFLGAWNLAGPRDPLLNGVLGALVSTYVTFLPCFMFIFIGAPYVEALAGSRRLQAALAGVTSAVVGVILNLAVFFGRHVLLAPGGGPDGFALLLAAVCLYLLARHDAPVQYLVPAGALAGMAWRLI